ncbi:MAG: hypothetical protein EXS15_08290 [Phycisphaerales bacterium]|nr:hypothetical protein [Phycisphaerales bacterium]
MSIRCALAVASIVVAVVSTACDSTKTVHVKRGAGMLGLEGAVGTETVLADGSRVIVVNELPKEHAAREQKKPTTKEQREYSSGPYSNPGLPPPPPPIAEKPKEFQLREVDRDGTVTLRAIMPEQVMAHLVEALKTREYKPFYEQMLADEARQSYERIGGERAFVEWAEKNRENLLAFLNRMGNGWHGTEVISQRLSPMRLRYRLDKRNLPDIRFESVDITMEHGGSRLAMVQ